MSENKTTFKPKYVYLDKFQRRADFMDKRFASMIQKMYMAKVDQDKQIHKLKVFVTVQCLLTAIALAVLSSL